jgi:hypothetical protein
VGGTLWHPTASAVASAAAANPYLPYNNGGLNDAAGDAAAPALGPGLSPQISEALEDAPKFAAHVLSETAARKEQERVRREEALSRTHAEVVVEEGEEGGRKKKK